MRRIPLRFARHGRGQQTFCCQKCDFQASFDHSTGEYAHIVGEDPAVEAAVNPA